MAIDLSELKTEIETDPLTLGYGNSNTTDEADADIMNNENGDKGRTVDKEQVGSWDVIFATTYDAYNNLTIDEQEWIRWITTQDHVLVTVDTKQKLAGVPTATDAIWAAGDRTAMNAAMLGLIQFTGSRAEELWGPGSFVTPSMVAEARALP